MSSSLKQNDNTKKTSTHDSGALAAWGMVGGGLLGAIIGLIFRHPWFGMTTLGVIGWITGALVDRSRR
jgi:uncharacterized membrane protein